MFLVPVSYGGRQYHNGHPARYFSRSFDRLFDDTVRSVFGDADGDASIARLPALDVRETDAGYAVQVDLPGVDKEDVKVTIEGKKVSIEATARSATEPAEGERQLVRERSTIAYARSFTLPVEVDEATSQAKLENGVLALTLAKKAKPAAQLQVA